MEVPKTGIHLTVGASFVTVAQQDQATPLGGTTYLQFYEAPDVNAAGKVQFRARVVGVVNVIAHFLYDPVGPTTTTLVAAGDAAPEPSGFFKTIGPGQLTD